jgi:hypothetical protein
VDLSHLAPRVLLVKIVNRVLQRAVAMFRARRLGPAYADAWEEWERSGDAAAWEPTANDGLEP